MTQPTNFSLTTTKALAASPVSPASPAAQAPQARERTIAPPTTFNTETGLHESVPGGWSGKDGKQVAEPPPAKVAKDGKQPTRHEQWLADQKTAREAREGKRSAKAAESQALARDFLKKGDLVGAAKSLGMSPAEFREYAQNVLLTVPTPDKELTADQKRAADEEAFRAEQVAFKKQQEAFNSGVIRAGYIKDKIAPVIADSDRFEFIHNEGSVKMAEYIYDFMNAHYGKTREELSVADVAEEIEKTLEKNFVASVEKARKMKKAARYFREEEPVAEVAAEGEPAPPADDERFTDRNIAGMHEAPTASRFPAYEEEALESEAPPPRQAIRREPGARVPFALMTREERRAQMAAEERAARRT